LSAAAPFWKTTGLISPRRALTLQPIFLFIGVVMYAILRALDLHPALGIIMMCIFGVGNILIPFAALSRRVYINRPFPWNWVLFLPTQLVLAFASAAGSILLIHWVYAPPFWTTFRQFGPMIIVVYMTVSIVIFLVEQIQRKLQEKNQSLERAVEKGSIALQQQEQELDRARQIQQDLLPKTIPQLPGVQIAGAWQPARTVGGDYFDVIRLDDHRLGICIGDVAGKGITAALLMANLQASFRAFATPEASPAVVCAKLNAFVCGNVATGKFITFFYAVLDAEHRTLTYENAGHCPSLLIRKTGKVDSLCGQGALLGVLPDWIYKDSEIRLESGDRLLLYTDGVTEAENQQSEEFGEDRLVRAAQTGDGTAVQIQRKIMETVTEFCVKNFHDDATLVVAAIL